MNNKAQRIFDRFDSTKKTTDAAKKRRLKPTALPLTVGTFLNSCY
jgi:hypothetical protein